MAQGQQGFLMLEALTASVVVSVAVLAIAGLFILSLQVNAVAADYTAATNLAQEKMELLSAMDTSALPSIVFADEEISLNNRSFHRQTTVVVRKDLDPAANFMQVTVQVSWIEAGKSFHVSLLKYFMHTVFSQYP